MSQISTAHEAMGGADEYALDDDDLTQAARRMRDLEVDRLPVRDGDGTFVGVISAHDIVTRAVANGVDPRQTRVSECATADGVAVAAHEPLDAVVRTMTAAGLRRLPVVDERNRLLGVITLEAASVGDDLGFVPERAGLDAS